MHRSKPLSLVAVVCAAIACIWPNALRAESGTIDGTAEFNFLEHVEYDELGNLTVHYYDFVSGSLDLDLNLPLTFEVTIASSALGDEATPWSNSLSWDSVPLQVAVTAELFPQVVEVVGGVTSGDIPAVYAALNEIDDLLESGGPTERGFTYAFEFKSDDPGLENWKLNASAGATLRFDVRLPSGADVLLNQTGVVVQNLSIANGAYFDGDNTTITIRENLDCRGEVERLTANIGGDFLALSTADVRSSKVTVAGNAANSGYVDAGLNVTGDLENVGTLRWRNGTVDGDVINSGTMTASGGVKGGLTNSGTLSAASLNVTGGVANTGHLTASGITMGGVFTNSGETLLTGGLTSGQPFTNTGKITIRGGSLSAAGGWTNASRILLESGSLGKYAGNGTCRNTGMIDFAGGELASTGLETYGGLISIVDGGAKTFTSFANYGTIQSNSGDSPTGSIINHGVIELSSVGGLATVTNYGRLSKFGGNTATVSSLDSRDGSVLEVMGGTLSVGSLSLGDGTYTIGGLLDVTSSATIRNDVNLTGGGTLRSHPGITFAESARLRVPAGLDLQTTTRFIETKPGKTATLEGVIPWRAGNMGDVVLDSGSKIVVSGESSRGVSSFTNRGTLEKVGVEHTTLGFSGHYVHEGSLRVTSGSLTLDTNIFATENLFDHYGGDYYVASGSALVFEGRGWGVNLYEDAQFSGGGNITVRAIKAMDDVTLSLDPSTSFTGYNNYGFNENPGNLLSTASGKTLTIEGRFRFGRGNITGNTVLAPNSVMEVYPASIQNFKGTRFTNHGLVLQTTGATVFLFSDFVNAADGEYELASTGGFTKDYYNPGRFYNRGLLRKTSAGTSTVSAPIYNEGGTIEVEAGELVIGSGVSFTEGECHVAAAATLSFAGGLGLNSDFLVSGGGTLKTGAVTAHDSVVFGVGDSVTYVIDTAGTAMSADSGKTLTLAGPITWKQGTLSGSTAFDSDAVVNVVAGGSKGLSGTLSNSGLLMVSGNEGITLGSGVIDNLSGGRIELAGSGGFSKAVRNWGWIQKTGSATVVLGGIDHYGTLQVLEGRLDPGGIKAYGGTITIAQGARLNPAGISVYGDTTITGSGLLTSGYISAAETSRLDISPSVQFEVNRSGYALGSEAGKRLSIGSFDWRRGWITGEVEIVPGAEVSLVGTGIGADKSLRGTLINQGRLVLEDGSFELVNPSGGAARLYNQSSGLILLQGTGNISSLTTHYIENRGVIRKTGTKKNSIGYTLYHYDGSLEVYDGELNTVGLVVSDAHILVDHGKLTVNDMTLNSGTLDLNEGTVQVTLVRKMENLTVTGSGTLLGNWSMTGATLMPGHSPGRLEITGDLTLDSTSRVVLEVLGGEWDQLVVGKKATLDGVLEVVLAGPTDFFEGQQFQFLQCQTLAGACQLLLPTLPDGQPLFSSSMAGGRITATALTDYHYVPEPSSLLLLMVALGCGAVARRRIRHRKPRG
ncbi:MAG: beta strand repeat-containing protein [Planctomycetota bacterium]